MSLHGGDVYMGHRLPVGSAVEVEGLRQIPGGGYGGEKRRRRGDDGETETEKQKKMEAEAEAEAETGKNEERR